MFNLLHIGFHTYCLNFITVALITSLKLIKAPEATTQCNFSETFVVFNMTFISYIFEQVLMLSNGILTCTRSTRCACTRRVEIIIP